jgi:hypothetical protein
MPEAARVPAPSSTAAHTRILAPGDGRELAGLVAGHRFTEAVLATELSDRHRYLWVGRYLPDGRLAAAHRALRWGDHLFFKGVFVRPEERGADHALRLALALRATAQREGRPGIAAWISESSPAQLALARRLRLKPRGGPLHLFAVPFSAVPGGQQAQQRIPSRERAATAIEDVLAVDRTHGHPAYVADLLCAAGTSGDRRAPAARAFPDRDRLLLGALPCATVADVAALLSALAPLAAALELPEVEVPVPLAALTLTLWLAGRKARRVSARPVQVGRFEF